MSIRCQRGHTHDTIEEVRACYGVDSSTIRPSAPTVPVASSLSLPGLATPKQVKFLMDLGVPFLAARRVDKSNASELITELLADKRGTSVPTPSAPPPQPAVKRAEPEPEDPRVPMIKGLIGNIPNGYFAVDQGVDPTWGDTGKFDFLRISRPKSGKYKDAIKIQSQHGDRLENRAVLWPSGRLSIFDKRVLGPLMSVLADHKTCLTTYGQVIGRCCRCHKQLTDDRSRHYGIGPECEQYFPWVIEEVDEKNALA